LAEQLSKLPHQRQALLGLIEVNQKQGYNDKCRIQKAQLERIDGLLKKSNIETLSVTQYF
jgi:regulator of PEP synthase PpsR (kinase-PPPase family)